VSTTTVFLIIIVGSGIVAVLGIFTVAFRRGASAGPITADELDKSAVAADRAARAAREQREEAAAGADDAGGVVTLEREDFEEHTTAEPTPDPVIEREEITATDYGVTRRKFLNRATLVIFGLFMAQFTLASLAFAWPKLTGGFGTAINAGKFTDIKGEITAGGRGAFQPKFVASAQSWIVPFLVEELDGSSFEDVSFVLAGGEGDGIGLMALWQRCVHLGCRVPDCTSSQGFECPCHGSKYNMSGEYAAGPAPRNLDRFGVTISDAGDFIIDTGTIVQTARSKVNTAVYPQGPFCV